MLDRFKHFRLTLVKNHAKMGRVNKCRGIYRWRCRWNKPTL